MWVKILIFGGLFLIVVWIVTKPWRDKHNIRIDYRQLFLKFCRFGFRLISPIVLIRWIWKLIRHLRWPSLTSKISSSIEWECPTSTNLWVDDSSQEWRSCISWISRKRPSDQRSESDGVLRECNLMHQIHTHC